MALMFFCIIVMVAHHASAAITKTRPKFDIYGNLLDNNDAKLPGASCCIIPTCNRPGECYGMLSCGYVCSTGKYPPAEYSSTPGYQLKRSYFKYDCKFRECRHYEFTCSHCQDPNQSDFSIYLVRDDCKDCYYH